MSVIAEIGEVMQLGFVPLDFDATLRFWVEKMGAGPFYIMRGNRAEFGQYRGQRTDPELTIAFGQWGAIQIEIVRQDNDAPSLYREWLEAGNQGLHHVCLLTDDMVRARDIILSTGAKIIYEGRAAGAEWLYADMGGGPGTIVEVTCHSPESAAMMAIIRESSLGWDGSDPVRYL